MNRKNLEKQSSKTLNKSKYIKKKNVIPLDIKLDVLRRFAAGEKAAQIGRMLNLPATTVRTICHRDVENIKELSAAATCSQTKSTVIKRNTVIVRMESLLSVWIERQTQRKTPLSKIVIQEKAKSIYDDLQEKLPLSNKSINEEFSASSGWFDRFKSRANLHNICLKGEAASADSVAAKEFCDNTFKAVVQQGGYTQKQIFNVDETGLFWKRLPKRTYISKEEASAPGFKVSKDRLTLLLGGNAKGDCKLKPFLIYNSENPRALKGVDKNNLPVYWKANNKAWMTGALFLYWVNNCAIPEFKKYCEAEKIEFKILVLLDNAPGHPTYLDNMTMKGFWKDYNILKAVNNIGESWKEVKMSCLNGVWRKLWPECVANDLDINDVPVVRREVVDIANRHNFEGVDEDGFDELIVLSEDTYESTQELIEMIENDNVDENSSCDEPQEITSKSLANAMKLITEGVEIFLKEDSDNHRSAKVNHDIKEAISCYEKLYMEKKRKAIQVTMDRYMLQQNQEISLE